MLFVPEICLKSWHFTHEIKSFQRSSPLYKDNAPCNCIHSEKMTVRVTYAFPMYAFKTESFNLNLTPPPRHTRIIFPGQYQAQETGEIF